MMDRRSLLAAVSIPLWRPFRLPQRVIKEERVVLRFKTDPIFGSLEMERINPREIREGDIVQICEPDGTPVPGGFGRAAEMPEPCGSGGNLLISLISIAGVDQRDLPQHQESDT